MKNEKHVMPEITVEYRGTKITYTQAEEWEVMLPGKKRPESNQSLELVKRAIDRSFRKDFDRIPVLVEKPRSDRGWGNSYRYESAMITSVGIEGEVFVVREGSKTAEEAHTIYLDTPENRKKMEYLTKVQDEIESIRSKASDLERTQYGKRDKLKEFDKEALRKKVLGE